MARDNYRPVQKTGKAHAPVYERPKLGLISCTVQLAAIAFGVTVLLVGRFSLRFKNRSSWKALGKGCISSN